MSGLHERTITVDSTDDLVISPLIAANKDAYMALWWRNRADIEAAGLHEEITSLDDLGQAFDDHQEAIADGDLEDGIWYKGQLVGQVVFYMREMPDDRVYEQHGEAFLNIWVDRSHWRLHLAERVVRTLAAAAFDVNPDLPYIRLDIFAQNTASQGLARKVGARLIATEKGLGVETWRLQRGATTPVGGAAV